MEYYFVVFSLAVLFCQVAAQDEGPLTAAFTNSEVRNVQADSANINLNCKINRNVMFVVNDEVTLRHERKVGDKVKSRILVQDGKLTKEASPSFYFAQVASGADGMITMKFEVKKVRDIDDGKFICIAKDLPDGEEKHSEVELVVVRPFTKLSLKFHDYPAIEGQSDTAIEEDAGTYTVHCIAEGSNPAASEVKLYHHGVPISTGAPQVEQMSGEMRAFRTMVEADVPIAVADSGKELECVAKSIAGDQLSSSVAISVKVHDPNVTCTETKARLHEIYPTLICIVDLTNLGVDSVENFGYQFGLEGEILKVGEQNDEYAHVESKALKNNRQQVSLNLYKAKKVHFETKFYLLTFHKNGHVSKELVRLHENTEPDGDGNHCQLLSVSLLTILLTLASTLLQTL